MFAEQISLHEWDTLELVVVDGFDECMLRLAEKRLMHIFDLVLEVWQCVDIAGQMACVANLLLG